MPLDTRRQASKDQDSGRTSPNEVQHQIPRGYTADELGFLTKVKPQRPEPRRGTGPSRSRRPMVTGIKKQGLLKPTVNNLRIFATRFHPDESEADLKIYVKNLIGDECDVEKIRRRTDRHSSFIITVSKRHEQIVLDPNSWEEGVQVRYFYGQLATSKLHAASSSPGKL